MGKKRNFKKRPWTHKDALKLLGELDGILLEGSSSGTLRVSLNVAGHCVEVIRDSGDMIHHSVTRSGVMHMLADELARHS